jgi:hypothetical protein
MSTHCRTALFVGYVTFSLLAIHQAEAAGAEPAPSDDSSIATRLLKDVPAGFPHFSFAAHDEDARLLTHYLWYHFHHRLGNGSTVFNKEYLLLADAWLGNASPRGSHETIQDVHRRLLLGIEIDAEGYVSSHQHFSHAHDRGWPFPLWAQAGNNPDLVRGVAAGWHFQPMDKVRGWVGRDYLRKWGRNEHIGKTAASLWECDNVKSLGIRANRWHLEATAADPSITTPAGVSFDAFNAPYLQLRWKRSGSPRSHAVPYVEWLRAEDREFGPDRRVYFNPEKTPLSGDCWHSIMTMHRHPQWNGTIKRVRIALAPGEADVNFAIDSFFTVYDTRHTINNPILILASCRYFAWTGDIDFLRRQIDRLRLALRYQQTVMGGLPNGHIRNRWPGHDGLPGWEKDPQGALTFHFGHGIGSNYWDILPFGWDDAYATNQYYAATVAMAQLEEAVQRHSGWDIPRGALQLDPQALRRHAGQVKETANRLFWNAPTGRFVACIDQQAHAHDYGYTFLNLDAIWYGLATSEHARQIMDWISGKRIVAGDTSTGADIYRWRFAPRSTTVRNIDWYGQGWWAPESLPWGFQVQDGGAVLGFTFYDLMARLRVYGADDAWQRLREILAWEKEVRENGGYRKYYADGKRGTTLQGGGTCGGLGIDYEFFESSLLPAAVVYGFLGLDAQVGNALVITPRLPADCPEMAVTDVFYHGVLLDIRVSQTAIDITCKSSPRAPIRLLLPGVWQRQGTDEQATEFDLASSGSYHFKRCERRH